MWATDPITTGVIALMHSNIINHFNDNYPFTANCKQESANSEQRAGAISANNSAANRPLLRHATRSYMSAQRVLLPHMAGDTKASKTFYKCIFAYSHKIFRVFYLNIIFKLVIND